MASIKIVNSTSGGSLGLSSDAFLNAIASTDSSFVFDFKLDVLATSQSGTALIFGGGNEDEPSECIQIQYKKNGSDQFKPHITRQYFNSESKDPSESGSDWLDTGTWYRAVLAVDRGTGFSLYIDGVLYDSITDTDESPFISSNDYARYFYWSGYETQPQSLSIRNMAFYNSLISSAQASTLGVSSDEITLPGTPYYRWDTSGVSVLTDLLANDTSNSGGDLTSSSSAAVTVEEEPEPEVVKIGKIYKITGSLSSPTVARVGATDNFGVDVSAFHGLASDGTYLYGVNAKLDFPATTTDNYSTPYVIDSSTGTAQLASGVASANTDIKAINSFYVTSILLMSDADQMSYELRKEFFVYTNDRLMITPTLNTNPAENDNLYKSRVKMYSLKANDTTPIFLSQSYQNFWVGSRFYFVNNQLQLMYVDYSDIVSTTPTYDRTMAIPVDQGVQAYFVDDSITADNYTDRSSEAGSLNITSVVYHNNTCYAFVQIRGTDTFNTMRFGTIDLNTGQFNNIMTGFQSHTPSLFVNDDNLYYFGIPGRRGANTSLYRIDPLDGSQVLIGNQNNVRESLPVLESNHEGYLIRYYHRGAFHVSVLNLEGSINVINVGSFPDKSPILNLYSFKTLDVAPTPPPQAIDNSGALRMRQNLSPMGLGAQSDTQILFPNGMSWSSYISIYDFISLDNVVLWGLARRASLGDDITRDNLLVFLELSREAGRFFLNLVVRDGPVGGPYTFRKLDSSVYIPIHGVTQSDIEQENPQGRYVHISWGIRESNEIVGINNVNLFLNVGGNDSSVDFILENPLNIMLSSKPSENNITESVLGPITPQGDSADICYDEFVMYDKFLQGSERDQLVYYPHRLNGFKVLDPRHADFSSSRDNVIWHQRFDATQVEATLSQSSYNPSNLVPRFSNGSLESLSQFLPQGSPVLINRVSTARPNTLSINTFVRSSECVMQAPEAGSSVNQPEDSGEGTSRQPETAEPIEVCQIYQPYVKPQDTEFTFGGDGNPVSDKGLKVVVPSLLKFNPMILNRQTIRQGLFSGVKIGANGYRGRLLSDNITDKPYADQGVLQYPWADAINKVLLNSNGFALSFGLTNFKTTNANQKSNFKVELSDSRLSEKEKSFVRVFMGGGIGGGYNTNKFPRIEFGFTTVAGNTENVSRKVYGPMAKLRLWGGQTINVEPNQGIDTSIAINSQVMVLNVIYGDKAEIFVNDIKVGSVDISTLGAVDFSNPQFPNTDFPNGLINPHLEEVIVKDNQEYYWGSPDLTQGAASDTMEYTLSRPAFFKAALDAEDITWITQCGVLGDFTRVPFSDRINNKLLVYSKVDGSANILERFRSPLSIAASNPFLDALKWGRSTDSLVTPKEAIPQSDASYANTPTSSDVANLATTDHTTGIVLSSQDYSPWAETNFNAPLASMVKTITPRTAISPFQEVSLGDNQEIIRKEVPGSDGESVQVICVRKTTSRRPVRQPTYVYPPNSIQDISDKIPNSESDFDETNKRVILVGEKFKGPIMIYKGSTGTYNTHQVGLPRPGDLT